MKQFMECQVGIEKEDENRGYKKFIQQLVGRLWRRVECLK